MKVRVTLLVGSLNFVTSLIPSFSCQTHKKLASSVQHLCLFIFFHPDYGALISCVVLVGLFSLQHHGTQRVAFIFAPIVTTWLLCISSIGIYNIFRWNPHIFNALSPVYMSKFFRSTGIDGWISLGGVVLSITDIGCKFPLQSYYITCCLLKQFLYKMLLQSCETMFADLDHFSSLDKVSSAFTRQAVTMSNCSSFSKSWHCNTWY